MALVTGCAAASKWSYRIEEILGVVGDGHSVQQQAGRPSRRRRQGCGFLYSLSQERQTIDGGRGG